MTSEERMLAQAQDRLVRRRPAWLLRLTSEVNMGDLSFRVLAAMFAALVVVLLVVTGLALTRSSSASLSRFGLGFLVSSTWDPVHQIFGALPFVWGTIVSSLLALAIAVPVSLGVAIFLVELAPPWARTVLAVLIETLAAVPSVIYGLWGVFVLAPWLRATGEPVLEKLFGFLPFFRGGHQGVGMLAGGLILAVMILPSISSVSREVLRAIPDTLREGALALGATRWEVVRTVVLPAARSGIIGAIVLGLGRALGETMAVTMVIGNRPAISASLFAPSYTMASVLANEFSEATEELHLAALAEIALLLFVITLVLNGLARMLVGRTKNA
jgi:phosphate transport system permease protein